MPKLDKATILLASLPRQDQKIWHTYLFRARKLTRYAVDTQQKQKIKPKEKDKFLLSYHESMSPAFYESLVAIVFIVFTAEYRINLVAENVGIHNKRIRTYIDEDENRKLVKKNIKFKKLSLYLRWRNILLASGRKETKIYVTTVRKLQKWITFRNKIAHADYQKLRKLKINPGNALKCYEDVIKALFELNVAIGYGKRKEEMETKRQVSLRLN